MCKNGYADEISLGTAKTDTINKIKQAESIIGGHDKTLEGLTSLRDTYISMLHEDSSLAASPDSKTLLAKYKFHNVNQLDKAIEIKTLDIKEYTSQGHQYVFAARLDLTMAEQGLNFLDACKSMRATRDKALGTQHMLEHYLKSYGEFIEHDMNDYLVRLENLSAREAHLAHGYAQKLNYHAQELSEIEKMPRLNALIKSSSLLTRWRDKLSQNYVAMSDQLRSEATMDRSNLG